MPVRALFLDATGVLLEPRSMPAQWQRLVGEFFPPRLGGEPAAWGEANAWAAERMFARMRDPQGTPNEVLPGLMRLWLREMCERVGVDVPRDAGAIVDEARRWCSERVVAPAEGAIEAVRTLHAAGYRLFTSTSNLSLEIDGYLRALGVRDLFERTYGIDLVDRWKSSSAFYARALADAGVAAGEAATVDDGEKRLGFARKAGFARTFLVAPAGTPSEHEVVGGLGEVVERL